MLALMLLHGAPYGNVLLAEKTKGLLLGCVLLRGANKVTVVAENTKHWKQLPIVEQLNIDKQRLAGVQFVEWSRYHAPEKKIQENVSKTLVPTTIDQS